MDLHGEFLFREDQFGEYRENFAGRDGRAAPILAHPQPGVAELLAGERAVGEHALTSRKPGLADGFGKARFFREKRREGKRAPGARAKDRLEPCGAHGHLASPKNLSRRLRPSSMRSSE